MYMPFLIQGYQSTDKRNVSEISISISTPMMCCVVLFCHVFVTLLRLCDHLQRILYSAKLITFYLFSLLCTTLL